MSERKQEVINALRGKGIDIIKVEKEVIALLRKGTSSLDVREYFKKILGDERK